VPQGPDRQHTGGGGGTVANRVGGVGLGLLGRGGDQAAQTEVQMST
jgi:hypothetical protein